MSTLAAAVAKVQADVATLKSATFVNAGQALAALEADVDTLSTMLNTIVAALTDLGVPGLTDDQKPVVTS